MRRNELGARRTVTLANMREGIGEHSCCHAANVFAGGWSIEPITPCPNEHAEVHDRGQTEQISKRKQAGVDIDDIDCWHPLVDVVCDPVLAGLDDWMGWMWIPPTHQGDDFQFCFFRGEREKHHSMEKVRGNWRRMIGTLNIDKRSSQITQFEQVANKDRSARFARPL